MDYGQSQEGHISKLESFMTRRNILKSIFFLALICIIPLVTRADMDGDGLPDDWENSYSCMQANTVDDAEDYDDDGLSNMAEYVAQTDPCVSDTDGDGMPDAGKRPTPAWTLLPRCR